MELALREIIRTNLESRCHLSNKRWEGMRLIRGFQWIRSPLCSLVLIPSPNEEKMGENFKVTPKTDCEKSLVFSGFCVVKICSGDKCHQEMYVVAKKNQIGRETRVSLRCMRSSISSKKGGIVCEINVAIESCSVCNDPYLANIVFRSCLISMLLQYVLPLTTFFQHRSCEKKGRQRIRGCF
jgi:hypothetical protein